jgi:hypothetical protein
MCHCLHECSSIVTSCNMSHSGCDCCWVSIKYISTGAELFNNMLMLVSVGSLACRSSRGSQSESWMTTALMPGRSVPSPHDRAASRNSLCREIDHAWNLTAAPFAACALAPPHCSNTAVADSHVCRNALCARLDSGHVHQAGESAWLKRCTAAWRRAACVPPSIRSYADDPYAPLAKSSIVSSAWTTDQSQLSKFPRPAVARVFYCNLRKAAIHDAAYAA